MTAAWPGERPVCIEERVKFPGLYLDYVVGVVRPEDAATYLLLAGDLQYVHQSPAPSSRTDAAYAWFAYRGDWLYCLDKAQRNAFVPTAFPEWLSLLANRMHNPASRLSGNGWNCCLIAYGSRTVWACGEDPWHEVHLALSPSVTLSFTRAYTPHRMVTSRPSSFSTEAVTDRCTSS